MKIINSLFLRTAWVTILKDEKVEKFQTNNIYMYILFKYSIIINRISLGLEIYYIYFYHENIINFHCKSNHFLKNLHNINLASNMDIAY